MAARERARQRAEGVELAYAAGVSAPPAPPPLPPSLPAPSPSKSAQKYVVNQEEETKGREHSSSEDEKGEEEKSIAVQLPGSPSMVATATPQQISKAPIVAPDGFAVFQGAGVDKRNLLAGVDEADVNTTHNAQNARAGTAEAHAIKIQEQHARVASIDTTELPSDETAGVDESDLASLPRAGLS